MSETPRIFVDKQLINFETGIISINDKDTLHYLKNVLRTSISDKIIVLDGCYNSFSTIATQINNNSINLKIQETQTLTKYPIMEINLFQGITKGDKQEFIIQKATELGVNSINSVVTEFSNVKLNDKDSINSKLERWKKVALNASQQSKRAMLPELNFFTSLTEVFKSPDLMSDKILNIVCFEDNSIISIKQFCKDVKNYPDIINIFIGPEGGWSNQESLLFDHHSINKVCLGQNILRAETATILSIGILLYEFEFK